MTNLKDEKIKHYCNRCQNLTNHEILYKKELDNGNDEYYLEWKYFTLECMGCEEISFRIETHDYEASYPDENDNWIHDISVEIYPAPLKKHKPLNEAYLLPEQIRRVYTESIQALKYNCPLLAGAGFRAVVEAVCLDKKIAGRTLEGKINNLVKNKLITEAEAERLHAVRFMGNDSIHEMSVPKPRTLSVVLQIVEHLLRNLYLIDEQARNTLDTYIKDFEGLEKLLKKKLTDYKKGDEFPLAKYLGKDVRRLNGNLDKFQDDLIKEIKGGSFKALTIGTEKKFGNNNSELVIHFIKN